MKKIVFMLGIAISITHAMEPCRINITRDNDGVGIRSSFGPFVILKQNQKCEFPNIGVFCCTEEGVIVVDTLKIPLLSITSKIPLFLTSLHKDKAEINAPGLVLTGENRANNLLLSIGSEKFRNEGLLLVGNLTINSDTFQTFQQIGEFHVGGIFRTQCGFDNYGNTEVETLEVTNPSNFALSVFNGNFTANHAKGRINYLKVEENGKANIKNPVGAIDLIKVNGGTLDISDANLQEPFQSIIENGSNVNIDGTAKGNQIVTENSKLTLSNSKGISFLSANGEEVSVDNIKKIRNFEVNGKGKFSVQNARLRYGKIDKEGSGTFNNAEIKFCTNLGDVRATSSSITNLDNRSSFSIGGESVLTRIENSKNIMFSDGSVCVGTLVGKEKSKVTVLPTLGAPIVQEEQTYANLLDRGISVYIDSIMGAGTIKSARQMYRGGFLQGYKLKGNADVFIDYMPENFELPRHKGDLNLRISLRKDYTNVRKRNYGDAIFFIDMNGNDWKNVNTDFFARGFCIENAGIFGNYNGRMTLGEFLQAKAEQIINSADPEEEENGAWHEKRSIFFSHKLHFYTPTKRYSQNKKTGMAAGNYVSLEASKSIENQASTMASFGNMKMKAGEKIKNTTGTIFSENSANITSPEIINTDMGVTSRRSGVWFYDIYAADIVNKSDEAKMIFRDIVNIKGNVNNYGSTLCGKEIHIQGDLREKSVLKNPAVTVSRNIDPSVTHGIVLQVWTPDVPQPNERAISFHQNAS